MSYSKGPASVSVSEFSRNSVSMSAYESRKDLVLQFLTATSLAGYWATPEHLEALLEVQKALAETVETVRREIETEERDND